MIDEQKINELVEKEVKRVVGQKVAAFGKKRIEEIYKTVVWDAVYNYLNGEVNEIRRALESNIETHKDDWKRQVSNDIADRISERIENSFSQY